MSVEDIIADGKLRLAVQPVFDETQLAAALQVWPFHLTANHCHCSGQVCLLFGGMVLQTAVGSQVIPV